MVHNIPPASRMANTGTKSGLKFKNRIWSAMCLEGRLTFFPQAHFGDLISASGDRQIYLSDYSDYLLFQISNICSLIC